ncbi:MAG TPA: M20/M25/M40 family metallo-hydrolase, partial [Pirellulales bacterium]|nr:M20/M25/M40 family metallo-hydrolase [Pirellulales bacterium]
MPLDLVQTLSDLVAIPSVNPMGRPLDGPEYYEERVTDYLQRLFERLNLPWQRQPVEPRRENIIARLDGDRSPADGGQVVLLEAHQDTVPVDGMTIDPWKPQVRDGRLYGRGACDIKGGMTAMLGAVARLAEDRPSGMPTVIMACTVNEEHGYSGACELP